MASSRGGGGLERHRLDGGAVDAGARPAESVLDMELRLLHRVHDSDLVLELQGTPLAGELAPPPEPDRLWQRTRAAPGKRRCLAASTCPHGRDVRESIAVLAGMTDPAGGWLRRRPRGRPRCRNRRKQAGTTTTASPGSGTSPTSATPVRPYLVPRSCWPTGCGGSAHGCSRTDPRPDRRTAATGRPVPEPEHLGLPGYPGGSDVIGNQASRTVPARSFRRRRCSSWPWRAQEGPAGRQQGGGRPEGALGAIVAKAETPGRARYLGDRARPPLDAQPADLRRRPQGDRRAVGAGGRWRDTRALGLADHLLSQADATSLHASGRWQRAPDDPRGGRIAPARRSQGCPPAGRAPRLGRDSGRRSSKTYVTTTSCTASLRGASPSAKPRGRSWSATSGWLSPISATVTARRGVRGG